MWVNTQTRCLNISTKDEPPAFPKMFGVGLVVPPEVLVLAAPKILEPAFVPVPPGGLKKDMVMVEDEVSRIDALCSPNQQCHVAVPIAPGTCNAISGFHDHHVCRSCAPI